MNTEVKKPPLRTDTLPDVKLTRIRQNASYAAARSSEHPDWYVSRFGYDHGALIAWDTTGKKRLVFAPDGDIFLGNVTRAVHELSPEVTQELVRGYRLARAAGLLNDGKINPEVAKLGGAAGLNIIASIRETLRKENYKPGGIPVVDEDKL